MSIVEMHKYAVPYTRSFCADLHRKADKFRFVELFDIPLSSRGAKRRGDPHLQKLWLCKGETDCHGLLRKPRNDIALFDKLTDKLEFSAEVNILVDKSKRM